MALGVHFENCDSLRDPVLGPLVSLGIYVELVHEGLDINFFLDGQKASLEFLSEVHFLVAFSLDLVS